jgi:hypothetical protein
MASVFDHASEAAFAATDWPAALVGVKASAAPTSDRPVATREVLRIAMHPRLPN